MSDMFGFPSQQTIEMIKDFSKWKDELIFTGRIVQDDDTSVPSEEAERRCDRYVELVEMANQIVEQAVFQALLDSMQVEDDYEVYESTFRIVMGFPERELGTWLAECMTRLIDRSPERAGDVLSLLVNMKDRSRAIHFFNSRLATLPTDDKAAILKFIALQEKDGWLEEKPNHFESR